MRTIQSRPRYNRDKLRYPSDPTDAECPRPWPHNAAWQTGEPVLASANSSHPGSAKPLANQFRHLPKASRRASAPCGRVITMAAYQQAKSQLSCCHRVLPSNRMAQRIADEVKACLLVVCGLSLPQASTSNWAACIALLSGACGCCRKERR